MKQIRIQGLARQLNRLVLVSAIAVAAIAGTAASAQIVTNGNFQTGDSSFSGYAGYGVIPDFTTHGSSSGVNGYDIHFNRPPDEMEKQFAPSGYYFTSTGTATNPRDFAFIQNSGDSLTQNLPNLNRLSIYQVTFSVAERYSDTDNVGTVSVTGPGVVAPASASVTGQSGFTEGSFTFETGLDYNGYVLTLANTTPLSVSVAYPGQPSQDRDVDFADIVITRIGETGIIPEPGTYALLGLGVLGLLLTSRRRMMNSQTKSSIA